MTEGVWRKGEDLIYWNTLVEKLLHTDEVIIYGAGLMGNTVKRCLEDAPYHVKIRAFVVFSMKNNPENIDGIPVMDLVHAAAYRNRLVLVALHERNMQEALKQLEEAGFRNCIPLSFDSNEWSDIRGNWFSYMSGIYGENYLDLNDALGQKLHVYVARSTSDQILKEEPQMRSFEIPIQVGAALADRQIAAVLDDEGENISEKNKKYCELTALYWIWKHEKTQYLGLSHYRRRFAITEQMAEKLPESDIDVVTTVPVLNINGVKQQYCSDHIERDWDICMKAVRELSPHYAAAADQIQRGTYYYAYNMLIARREILDQYCEWLFPILFQCEKKIGERKEAYQGRYIGFLAERLMTIFLEHHRKEFKQAIARKNFFDSR